MEILKSVMLGEAGGFAAVANPIPGSVSKKYSKAVMFCARAVTLNTIKKMNSILILISYSRVNGERSFKKYGILIYLRTYLYIQCSASRHRARRGQIADGWLACCYP